jgi:hypothetical protein
LRAGTTVVGIYLVGLLIIAVEFETEAAKAVFISSMTK